MGTRDLPHDTRAPGASSRHLPVLATFTFAIFLSAALLFAMQPMFTKLVLPRLGGAPAVWSVAMVFFQAALLAGYGYAHAADQVCARPPFGDDPRRVDGRGLPVAAAVDRVGLEPPGRDRRGVLAARPVRGLDRSAVLCARRQCTAAAGVVRPQRSSSRRTILISSMPPAMSAASLPCCPIRRWSSRSPALATRPGCGRWASSS